MKWYLIRRRRQTSRNVEPIITCNPWNPVVTKNVEPYTPSAMEKGAS